MEKQYRYPGARSFTEKDRELFFGRSTEIKQLTELVVLEKLVVLFGKSGYGKTSLLNAGVIPRLKKREGHSVLEIFLKEPEEPEINPVEQLLQQLKSQIAEDSFISEKLDIETELPLEDSAKLWYFIKRIQLKEKKSKAITLVFDHFGKLFVYRELQAKAFGRSLASLLNPRPPKAVRRLIKDKVKSDPDYFTESEKDQLFEPLNLKVLISISHDQLGSLDMLKPVLPAIFKYTYELQPLNEYQAVEVLKKPAKIKGKFPSPEFTYSKAAIDNILKSLKDKRTKRIETFQLQLIGQHAEEIIMDKKEKTGMSEFELSAADLGKPEKLFEDHYKGIVAGLPLKRRGKATKLVENALIVNGNRVPVADGIILANYHIKKDLLDILVDKRLLRSERNSVGGLSYELCHDTLIAPIQKASAARRQKVLLRNLLFVGLALLLITVSSASWAVIATNRAGEFKTQVDLLKEKIIILIQRIELIEDPVIPRNPEDIDEDSIPNGDDRCPYAPGPAEFKGCPDTDGDKIPDIDDRCPDVAGLAEFNGCPGPEPPDTDNDNDGDGVLNEVDDCPDEAGLMEFNGCPGPEPPDTDNDNDGILNEVDDCPDEAGLVEFNGCPGPEPLDSDSDSIEDTIDRCPYAAGLVEFKGCPDKDGDKIPDIDDQCPDVSGLAELNGCPDSTTPIGPEIFPNINLKDPYIIAISKPALVPRIFDAKRNDALYILINDGKKFMFWGFTSLVNPEAGSNIVRTDSLSVALMSTAQLKDDIETTRQIRVLNEERYRNLSFQDCDGNQTARIPFFSKQRYIDSDGTIHIPKNNQDAYQVFVDLLGRPSEEDCIYYTFLDWSQFDTESRNKITNVLNRLKAGTQ